MEYKESSDWLWIYLLLSTTCLIAHNEGASVSLTVEGGVSLVGSQCPGTVRLFCEAKGLTSLRWRYNGNVAIITFFPDGSSTTQPEASKFFRAELTSVIQDQNFGDYSSILSVDIFQLQRNKITDISCGNPIAIKTEPINVTVMNPSVPSAPVIDTVMATYQFEELTSIQVIWMKLDNFCPSHGFPLTYEVNLTSAYSIVVDHSNCTCGELCEIRFRDFMASQLGETKSLELTVTIKAKNQLGSSDIVLYTFNIARQADKYFISEVFSKNQQLFGRCTSDGDFVNAVCQVQYTTDPMYRNLSDEITAELNTEFFVVEVPAQITYYLQFTVFVNNTLQITRRVTYNFSTQRGSSLPEWSIVILALTVGFLLVLVIVIIALIGKKKLSKSQSEYGGQKESDKICLEPQTTQNKVVKSSHDQTAQSVNKKRKKSDEVRTENTSTSKKHSVQSKKYYESNPCTSIDSDNNQHRDLNQSENLSVT